MQVSYSDLPGVLLLKPTRFGDARGFFSESWNRKTLAEHGIALDFVQDNHSVSTAVDTVRGLHFQVKYSQAKLLQLSFGNHLIPHQRQLLPDLLCHYNLQQLLIIFLSH